MCGRWGVGRRHCTVVVSALGLVSTPNPYGENNSHSALITQCIMNNGSHGLVCAQEDCEYSPSSDVSWSFFICSLSLSSGLPSSSGFTTLVTCHEPPLSSEGEWEIEEGREQNNLKAVVNIIIEISWKEQNIKRVWGMQHYPVTALWLLISHFQI